MMRKVWNKIRCAGDDISSRDDEVYVAGPENVITVRTNLAGGERVPASLGNKTWSVVNWTNGINTSRYALWNFFPLNLFQQIIIPANFYFLVMAVLQLIPAISDSGGVPTYLAPLSFVFAVTMIKDAWEDIKRHRSDNEENSRRSQISTSTGEFSYTNWKTLRPGDIVRVQADEAFPADIIMICCSDEFGCAYVETVQLGNFKLLTSMTTSVDGETNMKTKTALPELQSRFSQSPALLAKCTLELTFGPPSAKLYQFNGGLRLYPLDYDFTKSNATLRASLTKHRSLFGADPISSFASPSRASAIDDFQTPGGRSGTDAGPHRAKTGLLEYEQFTMSANQFLWRGATLVNTAWIIGVVIYPGHNSRIFKNTRSRGSKFSGLMRSYNINAFSLFAMQLSFCILAGILYLWDVRTVQRISWYLAPETSREFSGGVVGSSVAFAVAFGRWILLLSYFIPITLLVQMEIARWFHGFYISADKSAYSEVTGSYPSVSTLGIIEDLGSVTHVFSDKTGTLTQNIMQLKCVCINGHSFGFEDEKVLPETAPSSEIDKAEAAFLSRQCHMHGGGTLDSLPASPQLPLLSNLEETRCRPNRYVDFDASQVRKRILTSDLETISVAREFLLVLSVCHSVLPKTGTVVERIVEPIVSQSPDQAVRYLQSPAMSLSRDSLFVSKLTLPSPGSKRASNSDQSEPLLGQSSTRKLVETPTHGRTQETITVETITAGMGSFSSRRVSQFSASTREEAQRKLSDPVKTPQPIHQMMGPSISHDSSQAEVSSNLIDLLPSPSNFSSSSSSVDHHYASFAERCSPGVTLPPTSTSAQSPSLPLHLFEPGALSQAPAESPAESPARPEPLTANFTWASPVSGFHPPPPAHPPRATARRLKNARSPMAPDATVEPGTQHRAFRKDPFHASTLEETSNASASLSGVYLGAVKWNGVLEANFDASSPDELALVAGAKHLGVEFLRRPDLNTVEVAVLNDNAARIFLTSDERRWVANLRGKYSTTENLIIMPSLTFELIEVLDFDNFRKRMSVIIRDRDGSVKLLCKGADSSMLAAAAHGQERKKSDYADCLADYAREGLRTLMFGYRVLSPGVFDHFKIDLATLRASGSDDVEKYAECYSKIERDLILVGCSAIDDKLQDQVPQTIEALRDAGVRVWVLTGDKVETAISIGHSCNLLHNDTYNAIIDGDNAESVQRQMIQYMAFVVGGQLAREAFDQILLQQNSAYLEGGTVPNSPSVAVGGCMRNTAASCRGAMKGVCCVKGETEKADKKKRRHGNRSHTVTMNLEDFVNILTFNAKHKKIVAPVDGHSAPKQLSPKELEQLIAVYVQHFRPPEEKAKPSAFAKFPQKLGELVGKKREASPTRVTVEPAGLSNDDLYSTEQCIPSPGSPTTDDRVEQYTSVAITITGDALQHALATDEARKYFFGLAHLCSTVIACRVTPKQKAEVVRLCRRCTPSPCFTSLGVGDGANDVGMILTADIGVGILGKEGSQAARSADISIGEFRILRNLLFAQGHIILRRHAIMMYQTIFKNIIFAMASYFSGFMSGFSASDYFDAYQKQLYNLFLTPWPIMAIAVFDRALPYDVLYKCASLYPIAMRPDGTQYFGARWFAAWFGYGIAGAGLVSFFSFVSIAFGATDDYSGRAAFDWAGYGQAVFTVVIFISVFSTIPFTHTLFWFTPLAFVLCIGGVYAVWAVLSSVQGSSLEGSIKILHQNGIYHLMMLLCAGTPLIVLALWWRYKVIFHPTPPVIIRERIKKGVFDIVLAPRHRGELAVVVPRQRDTWKGFAFAPSETRFSLRRKSLSLTSFTSNDSLEKMRPSVPTAPQLALIAEESDLEELPL